MPLVTPDGSLLPMPFIYDPKKKNVDERWANEKCQLGDFPDELRTLLESYLDIRWIQLNIGSSQFENPQSVEEDSEQGFQGKVPKFRFPAAVVSVLGEPEYQSVLVMKYFENAQDRFKVEKEKQALLAAEKARQEEEFRRIQETRPIPCKGKGCSMFGTAATEGLCSKCLNKKQKSLKKASSSNPPDSKVAYPGKWDIVLPDVVAECVPNDQSSVSDTNDDGGVKLLSHEPAVLTDSVDGETVVSSPSKSPKKSPLFPPKAPPMSPPKTPPKSPPKAPPKSPPKALPESPPKAPPKSPPKAPLKPTAREIRSDVKKHFQQAPPTRSTGYSRDHIKPLSSSGSGQELCTGGCGFFGSAKYDGMCSQCYKKIHPSITQV